MGDAATRQAERIDYAWVDTQPALDDVLHTLLARDRYALDTEFHRERTYFPKLALIQVAWLDDEAPGGQRVALDRPADRRRAGVRPAVRCPTRCA